MLDFADFVAINKFDRKGAAGRAARRAQAVPAQPRAVRKAAPDQMPVFGTIAARFNDDGVTALYQALAGAAARHKGSRSRTARCRAPATTRHSTQQHAIVPPARVRYLAEIAETRARLSRLGRRRKRASRASGSSCARRRRCSAIRSRSARSEHAEDLRPSTLIADRRTRREARRARRRSCSTCGRGRKAAYARRRVRREDPRQGNPHRADHDVAVRHARCRKVALPRYEDDGEILRWQLTRERARAASRSPPACSRSSARTRTRRACSPARATPFRTNRRFHLLADGMPAKRLSTAFDSVTLYGNDPDRRPDIYGKVGNSGVSIATLDDMKVLYSGFDLCAPNNSVSMTINGPAPTILAMFMNTAIDQQLDKFRAGQRPRADRRRGREDPRVDARDGARHGAGRHPEGRPGPEHLHLLDRVQRSR